jgi:hypothetical protein
VECSLEGLRVVLKRVRCALDVHCNHEPGMGLLFHGSSDQFKLRVEFHRVTTQILQYKQDIYIVGSDSS